MTNSSSPARFQQSHFRATLLLVAFMPLAGCGFDAQGTGIPPVPGVGCYNLYPDDVAVESEAFSPTLIPGVLFDGESFVVRWTVCYTNGTNQDALTSDPYITRVQVFSEDDGTLVERLRDEEVQSPAIATGDCREEEFAFEGLPPGEYRAVVRVNNDEAVQECAGSLLANIFSVSFTVIDGPGGLTNPSSGADAGSPQQAFAASASGTAGANVVARVGGQVAATHSGSD